MTETPTAIIREVAPGLTTFTIPFNRFAPFGYRNLVAVGNRATAINLSSGEILLLSPIPLTPAVRQKLESLGGVHFIAADLGHHLSVHEYVAAWPAAKTIGVPDLQKKRNDVRWDWIYGGDEELGEKAEEVFGWEDEVESVFFEGFITRAVAWWHVPTKTLVVSDLLMNLPCTEVRRCHCSFCLLAFMMLCYVELTDWSSNTNRRQRNGIYCLESLRNELIRDRCGLDALYTTLRALTTRSCGVM